MEQIISIPWKGHNYPIRQAECTAETVQAMIYEIWANKRRVALVTDSNVGWLKKAWELINWLWLQDNQVFVFPAWEQSKNRDTFNEIQDWLLREKYWRDSLVIALGWGVVWDMAWLVADQHNRWVPLIQIPTTVLAQADSSIWWKVWIDVWDIKNAVWAFKQPNGVIIDTWWLKTLTDEHYRAGMAETVKHWVLADRNFFDWLIANAQNIASRNLDEVWEKYIAEQNCRIKWKVVMADPEEWWERKTLNLWHTAWHAIESASNYTLPHWYCVAIWMQVATKIAILLKTWFTQTDLDEQTSLLTTLQLPIHIPRWFELDQLIEIMKWDKKNTSWNINFSLPSTIWAMNDFGWKWVTPVSEWLIREVLTDTMEI